MRIAYVLNTYPQPSHSFIRRELHALERQGFTVTRLAMRGPDMALVDPGDRAEAEGGDLSPPPGDFLSPFLPNRPMPPLN